jgi:uncharacterized phage protein (TIGR02220 family)
VINPNNYYTIQGWMLSELGLKGNALAAYAIIYGFSQDGKSEYAGSSAYLCEWLGCTKKTALTTLAELTEKGYLKKRVIIDNGVKLCNYVALRPAVKAEAQPGEEITPGRCKNYTGGGEEITPGRCKNYTGGGEEITPHKILDNIDISNYIKTIVEYLNQKAGKKYRAGSKDTRQHINARLAEGYTLDDFRAVIDKRCAAWLGDPKMEEYLRPSTLFGPKFESYLNAPAATQQPRPAGRGYGAPAPNVGPNGIAYDPTKTDLDGLME